MKDAFSEVFKLANVSLVLPLNTAIVERGFSKMNIVKDKLRNRMLATTTEKCMHISVNGPELTIMGEKGAILTKEAAALLKRAKELLAPEPPK